MQKDLGELLWKAVLQSNMSITGICLHLHKQRSWLYYQFRRKNIPIETLLLIGSVIRHDFTDDIPELKRIAGSRTAQESNDNPYGRYNEEFWKTKYYALLEEHIAVLKQLTPLPAAEKRRVKRKPK